MIFKIEIKIDEVQYGQVIKYNNSQKKSKH